MKYSLMGAFALTLSFLHINQATAGWSTLKCQTECTYSKCGNLEFAQKCKDNCSLGISNCMEAMRYAKSRQALVEIGKQQEKKAAAEAGLRSKKCPGCNFADMEIKNLDLTGANFKGANFSGAKIRNCYFKDADLSNADFSYANIRDTHFIAKSLNGIKAQAAYLDEVDLSAVEEKTFQDAGATIK